MPLRASGIDTIGGYFDSCDLLFLMLIFSQSVVKRPAVSTLLLLLICDCCLEILLVIVGGATAEEDRFLRRQMQTSAFYSALGGQESINLIFIPVS